VRANSTSTIVKIAESAYAAVVSVVFIKSEQHAASIAATHLHRCKALGMDSESRILAMKKFSCEEPSRLIAPRQIRFFARIAETDSQARFARAMHRWEFANVRNALARARRGGAPTAPRGVRARFRSRVSTSTDR
jgi:hypothetical protein